MALRTRSRVTEYVMVLFIVKIHSLPCPEWPVVATLAIYAGDCLCHGGVECCLPCPHSTVLFNR
jgi:hypothetical protein